MAEQEVDDTADYFSHSYATWSPQVLLKSLNVAFENELTTQSPKALQPQQIKMALRPHQLAVLAAMAERENGSMTGYQFRSTRTYATYGVLGDEVGSGKSLMVLSYIAALKGQQDPVERQSVLVPHSSRNLFTINTRTFKDMSKTSLIIVPHTIYRQWQDYCKNQTTLTTFYAKSHKDLADGMSLDISGNAAFWNKVEAADVVLVSNTLLSDLQYIANKRKYCWKRVFIDEADSVYVSSTVAKPIAAFTWFITATWANFIFNGSTIRPALLEYYEQHKNDYNPELGGWLQEELGIKKYVGYGIGRTTWLRVRSTRWLESFQCEHALRAITLVKCSPAFLKESQTMPPIINTSVLCEQPISHRVVASIVGPAVRNMLHAGNIEGALAELGVPADTPMDLINAVTLEREKELIRLQKTLAFKETMDYATPQAKELALASLRSKIASIEEQLKTFKERLTNVATEECPICYEDPKQNKATVTPCCHRIFCGGCILQSLARGFTCPMCRAELRPHQLTILMSDAEKEKEKKKKNKKDSTPKLLSKPKSLLKFLKENPTARVLVFSRYDNPFVALEKSCELEGISYHTLRGNKDVIASTIKSFEKGEKRVLFLPTQTAGAGLNLVSATHVVLLHAMTPEEEKQVIGRAYRLGRTQDLNVVRLVHEGETIESQA